VSGVLAGKMPRTDEQWARDVQQRLDQLEHPKTQRVADWVFSQDTTGALQATKPGAGSVIIDSDGNLISAAISAGAVPVTVTQPLTWQAIWNLFTGSATSTSTSSSPASEWIAEIQAWLTAQWNKFLTPDSTQITDLQTALDQLGQIYNNEVVVPITEAVSQAQAGWNSLLFKVGLVQSNGSNLVLDPSFTTPTLWAGEAGSQTSAQAHSGIYCWQLEGQG
jgi:hypothetical protein